MSKCFNATAQDVKGLIKEGVVLLDFWAEWCGPCRMMAPILDEVAEELDGKAKIVKVNVDEMQEFAIDWQVRAVPTCIIISNGSNEVQRFVGVTPKIELLDAIDTALEQSSEEDESKE